MSDFSAFSDDAVGAEDDVLGRDALVGRMTQALEAARLDKSSSVLGLVGPWGSGKTSVLDMLRDRLKSVGEKWQWVNFNPWFYPDEASMQFGFFNELRGHMRTIDDPAAKHATKQVRKSLGSLMETSAPFIGALSGVVGVNPTEMVKRVAELISGEESTSRAFDQARVALQKVDVPFVVVLDDLDRLDPGELLLVARLVRLVGRLPNVHYLLAYDERTLIDLLQASPLVGKDSGRAGDYLEKIVQLRFDMPPLREKQVDDLVNEELNRILVRLDHVVEEAVLRRFRNTYDQALRGRFRTVRGIRRYFAQVAMIAPDVLRELNLSDYLLLTWLRVEEPHVYHWLARNRNRALDLAPSAINALHDPSASAVKARRELQQLMKDAGVAREDRDSVLDVLVALFPVLQYDRDGKTRQPASRGDASERRISHPDYFDRYFALEVPAEDFPNVAVAQGVAAIAAGNNGSDVARALQRAFLADPALVRDKLELTTENAPAVAEWMAQARLQEQDELRWVGSLGETAGQLLTTALAFTPPKELPALLKRIAADQERLHVLANSCRSLLLGYVTPLGLTEDALNQAKATVRHTMLPILTEHFRHENRDPIDGGTDLWVLIWLWKVLSEDAPRTWIRQQVESAKWDLIRLVGALAPIGISPNGTRSLIDPLTREELERFLDVDWLIEQARSLDLGSITSTDGEYDPGEHSPATPERLEALARATIRWLLRATEHASAQPN